MIATLYRPNDLLSSDGRFPERLRAATVEQHANAAIWCARVNALFAELGAARLSINEGLRPSSATWGAKHSAHKMLTEGIAAGDLNDPDHAFALRVTRQLLAKHGLRREDTRDTTFNSKGKRTPWCHLDTYLPYGVIFRP